MGTLLPPYGKKMEQTNNKKQNMKNNKNIERQLSSICTTYKMKNK
jgi:hypothetical protein